MTEREEETRLDRHADIAWAVLWFIVAGALFFVVGAGAAGLFTR